MCRDEGRHKSRKAALQRGGSAPGDAGQERGFSSRCSARKMKTAPATTGTPVSASESNSRAPIPAPMPDANAPMKSPRKLSSNGRKSKRRSRPTLWTSLFTSADRTRAARSTATVATRRRTAQSDAHSGRRHSLTDPQPLLARSSAGRRSELGSHERTATEGPLGRVCPASPTLAGRLATISDRS